MQKQLKMGIMAAFVAALSGCGEQQSDDFDRLNLFTYENPK